MAIGFSTLPFGPPPDITWVILFYALVLVFIYLNRKKLEIHFKIFAMYKSRFGIKFMVWLGSRFSRPLKVLGYFGIFFGFAGMILVVGSIFFALYTLFFVPNAPASIAPVLPGVKVPGTTFFIPFWYGIISIFVVAVVHEFGHGLIASAHKVPLRSTGPFVMGPFFGAFVEPDEFVLKKKKASVQHSIFAAGPFFNILLALVCLGLINFAFVPVLESSFHSDGFEFVSFLPNGTAVSSGLKTGVLYDVAGGKSVGNVSAFVDLLKNAKPGQKIVVGNSTDSHVLLVGSSPSNSSVPYIGAQMVNRFQGDDSFGFSLAVFVVTLFSFIFTLSIAIGTANLLPLGPIDGGRIVLLGFSQVFGEKKGKEIWSKVSIALLFFIVLLMTPIFKATLQAVFGLSL